MVQLYLCMRKGTRAPLIHGKPCWQSQGWRFILSHQKMVRLFPHQLVIWNVRAENKAGTRSWVNSHKRFRRWGLHSESSSDEVEVRCLPSGGSKKMPLRIKQCLDHPSWEIPPKNFRCFRQRKSQGKILIWIETWTKGYLRFSSYVCEAVLIFKPAENISKLIIRRKRFFLIAPFMQSLSYQYFLLKYSWFTILC